MIYEYHTLKGEKEERERARFHAFVRNLVEILVAFYCTTKHRSSQTKGSLLVGFLLEK